MRIAARPARPDDATELVAMINQLATHHGDVGAMDVAAINRDAFGATPWISVLVAEGEAGLAGYAILCPLYRAQFGSRGMDMHHLYVSPQYRGAKIGRGLVEAAVAHARDQECSYLTVGTHRDNVDAQQFYLGAGFAPASPSGPRFKLQL